MMGSTETGHKEKAVTLRNMVDEQIVHSDTLHLQAAGTPTQCTAKKCMGSIMVNGFPNKYPKLKNQTMSEAKDFIKAYYASNPGSDVSPFEQRLEEVTESIENTGSYHLTHSELRFGCKTAWRNASRCVGRIQWSNLEVFDARHVTTAKEMFDYLMKHLEYATNGGNLRSAITVFPQRKFGTTNNDFRIWNSLLIGYAGYKQPNGDVIGDPKSVQLTEICKKLGWKGKGGMFDVLPLVLQADGDDPELFEIPDELVLQVPITHPRYPRFAELGLKWIAVPGVANMLFDCGGLEFTGCQFSGWYMSTEIVRDLSDLSRYNILKPAAEKMDIRVGGNATLWKDKALLELNVAVLHSYQKHGVTLTDHHSASESFMTHLANEQKDRGGCPADWVWIVPPMSSSITQVFHQEMLNYKLRPSYEYQEMLNYMVRPVKWVVDYDSLPQLWHPYKSPLSKNDPWLTYTWHDENLNNVFGGKRKRNSKKLFQSLVRSTMISQKLMVDHLAKRPRCLVIYASETGRSAMFAEQVHGVFKKIFNSTLACMSKCGLEDLKQQNLVICVTSTFGNGDPPGNAKLLYGELENAAKYDASNQNGGVLEHIFYSVFALGSRAYPKFCQFGHTMQKVLKALGGVEIEAVGEGDELQGQEEPFRNWLADVFKAVCGEFVVDKTTRTELMVSLGDKKIPFAKDQVRLVEHKTGMSTVDMLRKSHSKEVRNCTVKSKRVLQEKVSDAETLLIELECDNDIVYSPGDHVAIFPQNDTSLVNMVLGRLKDCENADQIFRMEMKDENGEFATHQRLPPCSIRQALTFLLDLKTPPNQIMLTLLAEFAGESDCKRLLQLAEDNTLHQSWMIEHWCSFGDVLTQFPSLHPPASILLMHLPILPARYYSISSSLEKCPGEIHITVGLYNFFAEDGSFHKGLCSNWLKDISLNDQVPLFIRREADFHLPSDPEAPVIMIGPGTGIAPFRSFWQQREIDASKGVKVGPLYLYFGCRNEDDGNLYAEETSQLTHIITGECRAFSRPIQGKKMYVQNLLFEDMDRVKELLRKGAHIYVCGGIKMAADVQKTITKFIQEEHNSSLSVAKDIVTQLKKTGYYHEDIYGVNLKVAAFIRKTSFSM